MKNINSIQILKNLFLTLDVQLNNRLEVYVIGGANLIAHGLVKRVTHDIDVIDPEAFSSSTLELIEKIGKEHHHIKKWINTEPSRDARFLNEGWKKRSSLFYSGRYLKAWMLHRQDMICMKLAAALDRQFPDRDDLLALKPNESEWEIARIWARQYDQNPDWPEAIDALVMELKEEQINGA